MLENDIKIDFPNDKFWKDNLKKVKKIKDKINLLWKKDNFTDKDENKILTLEKKIKDYISLYLITKKIDKIIDRKQNQQYDVTKIWINNKSYLKMKSYDKKIVKILYDYMTNQKINNEVSTLHLFSGFAVKKMKTSILIEKDVLKNI